MRDARPSTNARPLKAVPYQCAQPPLTPRRPQPMLAAPSATNARRAVRDQCATAEGAVPYQMRDSRR